MLSSAKQPRWPMLSTNTIILASQSDVIYHISLALQIISAALNFSLISSDAESAINT